MRLRELPTRLATGAYILHSELEPTAFLKRLSTAEIAVGSLLLAPFVPTAVAGAALTGFAGGLVTMYLRTPAMRKPGSIWPSQQGTAVSKDVWMLGVGLGLLADALVDRRRSAD